MSWYKQQGNKAMQITIQDIFEVTRNGATVKLDATKLNETMLGAIFAHGVAAKVGDAAAAATTIAGESHFGKPKKQVAKGDWDAWKDSPKGTKAIADLSATMMQAVIDSLEEGNWTQRGTGVSRVAVNDETSIALRNAKADLLIIFKKVTGQGKIAAMVDHEKVAPFFNTSGDNVVWNDEIVMAWIGKQVDKGKDYIAEAKATLEAMDKGEDLLDL